MNGNHYKQEEVVKIIEKYCEDHGIDEQEFAALIGKHPTHLSRIKKGLMSSPEVLQKIAALGKRDWTELLRATPEKVKTDLIAAGSAKNIPVSV